MTTPILVDGSNTLFWRGQSAQQEIPEMVVRALLRRRFAPVVYFDHTVSRHMDAAALAAVHRLARVHIAPRGTPADAELLRDCMHGRHQIVSNDRFSDWQKQYPHLQKRWRVSGRIGKGGTVSFSKTLRAAALP